jgi:hypothetical protein
MEKAFSENASWKLANHAITERSADIGEWRADCKVFLCGAALHWRRGVVQQDRVGPET